MGMGLSKEVLWVSVGQLASKLQAVKVGGLKKIVPLGSGVDIIPKSLKLCHQT